MSIDFVPQKLASLFVMLILLTSACKDAAVDDLDFMFKDEPGTIRARIDGRPFEAQGFFEVSSKLILNEEDNSYRINFSGEHESNGIEDRITFSLFGIDFSKLKVGDAFEAGANLNEGGKNFDGDYYRISRTEEIDLDIISDSEQVAASTATITTLDPENRLISGTFKFKAIDIDANSSNIFQITEGVFTELKY